MRGHVEVTIPEIARTVSIRAALGIGLGLLLANRLSDDARRAVGWTLLVGGAVAATLLGSEVFGRPRSYAMSFGTESDENVPPPKRVDPLLREMLRVGD